MMISMSPIDPLDARILLALDDDPDATILSLARSLGVARNTVQARLKRLEAGALRSFGQRVDPAALGYPLVAFVSLSISQSAGDAAADDLSRIPEVIEIHATTGDADMLVKVVARDTAHLYALTTAMPCPARRAAQQHLDLARGATAHPDASPAGVRRLSRA